jgi:hypothetical protein
MASKYPIDIQVKKDGSTSPKPAGMTNDTQTMNLQQALQQV